MDELLNNEDLQAELENARTIEEIVEILNAKGIEISEDRLKVAMSSEGELDESELEDVAGGAWFGRICTIVRSLGGGAFGGGGKMGGR